MEPTETPTPGLRERAGRFVPRSSRLLAVLLATAALLALALGIVLGKAGADTQTPLRTATPLVPRSQAVEIRGLPAARTLPTLRPRPAPASTRDSGPKPVVIVGEG